MTKELESGEVLSFTIIKKNGMINKSTDQQAKVVVTRMSNKKIVK